MPRNSPHTLLLDCREKQFLEAITRKYRSPYRDVMRAKVIVFAAQGLSNKEIGKRLDLPRQIVLSFASAMPRIRVNFRSADDATNPIQLITSIGSESQRYKIEYKVST